MANQETVTKCMGVWSAQWPNFPLTEATIAAYCDLLKDIDGNLLEVAARECSATCKFFPTVAEIREKCNRLAELEGSDPTAEEAWELVNKAIREVGSYSDPNFSSPLIHRAVGAVGGWYHLCVEVENFEVVRSQFIRIYDSFVRSKRERKALSPETEEYLSGGKKDELPQNQATSIIRSVANKLTRGT